MTRYNDFGNFLKKHFEGKVQKISVHAGFTCPNRDGSKGYGGCTYCNNQTFSPDYCQSDKSISQQIAEGIRFFSRKYPQMQYLAYFQSYTNTYGETAGLRFLLAITSLHHDPGLHKSGDGLFPYPLAPRRRL